MKPFTLFLFLFFFCAPAYAAQSIVNSSQQELQDTLNKIKASEAKQSKLKAQAGQLEKQLTNIQQDSTHIALKVQSQERLVAQHEEKIAILEAQRKEKLAAFDARRRELAKALSAMIKLSQTPKEAVIAEPGSLEKTLHTAEALGVMTEALRKEAASLHDQLTELDDLKLQIEQRYREANTKKLELAREQKKLFGKVQEMSKIRDKLYRDEKREAEAAARLSRKSQSLQELLSSLENQRRDHRPAFVRGGNAPTESTPNRGSLRMPVEGRIAQHFGEGKSRGWLITTLDGAQVVAPAKGEVVFTGPFMDYGRMVIIRHSGELHTLLAGFNSITVSPGDKIDAGEPLGRMGGKNTGNRLYLELRREGRPVDPTPWFK